MCEDVLSDGVQVAGVRDVADVLRHSLDHHVTRREHKLVGAHLYLGGGGCTEETVLLTSGGQ